MTATDANDIAVYGRAIACQINALGGRLYIDNVLFVAADVSSVLLPCIEPLSNTERSARRAFSYWRAPGVNCCSAMAQTS